MQKLSNLLLALIFLSSLFFFSCTRELKRQEEISRPFEISQIPTLSAGGMTEVKAPPSQVEVSTPSPELYPSTVGSANPKVAALIEEGREEMRAGRLNQAIAKFKEVLESEPQNAIALYNLGKSYRELGDTENAIKYSKMAVEADPEMLYVHQNLAYAYMSAGKVEEAMSEFEEELRRHPDEPHLAGIAVTLGNIYFERQLMEEAFDAAKKATLLDPKDPAGYILLGRVNFKNGAWDNAIKAFEEAVKLAPNNAEPRKLLADALWEAGRKEEARIRYGEAVALDPKLKQSIDPQRLPENSQ